MHFLSRSCPEIPGDWIHGTCVAWKMKPKAAMGAKIKGFTPKPGYHDSILIIIRKGFQSPGSSIHPAFFEDVVDLGIYILNPRTEGFFACKKPSTTNYPKNSGKECPNPRCEKALKLISSKPQNSSVLANFTSPWVDQGRCRRTQPLHWWVLSGC